MTLHEAQTAPAARDVSPVQRPVRVLSIPGRQSTTQFVPLFCQGLERAGVDIVDLGSSAVLRLGFDVIHLHFPVHYIAERSMAYSLVRSAFLLVLLTLAKTVGRSRVVYTVHDPVPFRPRAGWLMWPMLGFVHRMVDGMIFLSDGSQRDFLARFPRAASKPAIRIDHSSFPVAADPVLRRAEYRSRAAADRRELLIGYLGMIKSYKGLDFLSSLPSQLADGTMVRTIVAGKVDPTFAAVADPLLAGLGDSFTRVDKHLSDPELEDLIKQVDVVFLPYTRGWNSGMAMLVLSCYTPMLSSKQLPFLEVQNHLGTPWVHTFEGEAAISQPALEAALMQIKRTEIDQSAIVRLTRFLEARSFDAAGTAVKAFYERLLAR